MKIVKAQVEVSDLIRFATQHFEEFGRFLKIDRDTELSFPNCTTVPAFAAAKADEILQQKNFLEFHCWFNSHRSEIDGSWNKIKTIKAFREINDLGLADTKKLVEDIYEAFVSPLTDDQARNKVISLLRRNGQAILTKFRMV